MQTFLFYFDGELLGIGTQAEADVLFADGIMPSETELRAATKERVFQECRRALNERVSA